MLRLFLSGPRPLACYLFLIQINNVRDQYFSLVEFREELKIENPNKMWQFVGLLNGTLVCVFVQHSETIQTTKKRDYSFLRIITFKFKTVRDLFISAQPEKKAFRVKNRQKPSRKSAMNESHAGVGKESTKVQHIFFIATRIYDSEKIVEMKLDEGVGKSVTWTLELFLAFQIVFRVLGEDVERLNKLN